MLKEAHQTHQLQELTPEDTELLRQTEWHCRAFRVMGLRGHCFQKRRNKIWEPNSSCRSITGAEGQHRTEDRRRDLETETGILPDGRGSPRDRPDKSQGKRRTELDLNSNHHLKGVPKRNLREHRKLVKERNPKRPKSSD